MSLLNIIKTIREVEAFISESVSKNDEGEEPKRRKGFFSGIAVVLTLAFFLDLHTLAFEKVKVTLAPPPREEQVTSVNDSWSEYLEERISKSLDRIYELEALLTESREQVRFSEAERERLESKIEELQNELDQLRRTATLSEDNSNSSLYERLNPDEDD